MTGNLRAYWKARTTNPYDMVSVMNNMPSTRSRLRDQALFAFLYLTACRVEEVVRYTCGSQPWENKDAVRKAQVVINPADRSRVVITHVRCLKRKMFKYKVTKLMNTDGSISVNREKLDGVVIPGKYRNVGIKVNELEKPFWEVFKAYIDTLDYDTELFPITPGRAYQILGHNRGKGGGIHPHAIRHQRLTHLTNLYRLSSQQLRRHCGWASSMTADHYVDSSAEDIIDSMTPK